MSSKNEKLKNGEPITPKKAQEMVLKNEAIIVDVREEGELIAEGFAKGARWMPTSLIGKGSPTFEEFLEALPKGKAIITYCAAGMRSGRAAAVLSQLGFDTYNMGGFYEWSEAGLPVEHLKPSRE